MHFLKHKSHTSFLFHVSDPNQTHNFGFYVSKNNLKEYLMTLDYYSKIFLVSPLCGYNQLHLPVWAAVDLYPWLHVQLHVKLHALLGSSVGASTNKYHKTCNGSA